MKRLAGGLVAVGKVGLYDFVALAVGSNFCHEEVMANIVGFEWTNYFCRI